MIAIRPTTAMLALSALALAACGGLSETVPTPAHVRESLASSGIDLRTVTTDARGCLIMAPRATNTGATRTYGQFTLIIATRDSCNDAQTSGSAGDDHIYWTQRGSRWIADEELENNLWLRMSVPSRELGDEQRALQEACYHTFDAGQ